VVWPFGYFKEYKDAYLGLDDPDCPASVRELYSYKPEKAKQLLKEAGYPNGFSIKFYTWNPAGVSYLPDLAQIIQADWAKVGIIQMEFLCKADHLHLDIL
jgi:peptide/nickel transport system substrate-binding protein